MCEIIEKDDCKITRITEGKAIFEMIEYKNGNLEFSVKKVGSD